MAVLPHSSPGYPDWDVAEQPRLLKLIKQTRSEQFPSRVDVFDSGMLRPKKTQLAVFGVTRHTERLQRLTDPYSVRKLLVWAVPVSGARPTSERRGQAPSRCRRRPWCSTPTRNTP